MALNFFEILHPFDEMCMRWVTSFRAPPLNVAMTVTARLGDFGGIWLLTAALLITRSRWRISGVRLFCCLALCFVVTNIILKNIIARPRPFDVLPWLQPLIVPPEDYSFPSGHTASAFASAFALWNGFGWKYGVPAMALAVLIAFARVYVGAHYVSDVAAGAVTGIVTGYAGTRIDVRQ